ncbi:hypothetical protein [Adlercreutzia caecimuris]|uniref:hypothetical protein n=1 Tax=Adlercreutzia caecimuris TaxID=671266 RepID=UPI0014550A09|nr:hypothetical protein [Adlercreutzia caecimuris]
MAKKKDGLSKKRARRLARQHVVSILGALAEDPASVHKFGTVGSIRDVSEALRPLI